MSSPLWSSILFIFESSWLTLAFLKSPILRKSNLLAERGGAAICCNQLEVSGGGGKQRVPELNSIKCDSGVV